MITQLEDFLRRCSKIEGLLARHSIINAPSLSAACTILFGEQAEAKLQEYSND
ncbi:MAG: hypothetical protein ACI9WS_003032 [Paraglaciecola psychrophila]|jgi:hypothetical protein